MLFNDSISVCKITRDSGYLTGKNVDMSVTFGGNKNPKFEKYFNDLQDLGIVPMFSCFLEYKVVGTNTDIIYYISTTSGDTTKISTEYRKISIPFKMLSIGDLKYFVVSEIKNNSNSFYFMVDRKVDLISRENSQPNLKDVEKGLEFLKSLYGKYNSIVKADNFTYCIIEGKTYILATVERENREFLLLPSEYTKDSLIEYLKIITTLTTDKIIELLPSILN